jgi:cytochrome P450
LLTILTTTEFFEGDDNLIIDEIITFFFAGMKTIQISTANLIYYLTKHADIRKKLLAEILPPVEAVKDNIIEGFKYDTVMEFEYLQ